MLDLKPIKIRVEAGAKALAVAGNVVLRFDNEGDSLDDATRALIANAPADLAALVAEVESLRALVGDAHDYLAARNLGDQAFVLRGRLRAAILPAPSHAKGDAQ